MAGGEKQGKLPIAVPIELWLGMSLNDDDNPTELWMIKKNPTIFK